MFKGLRPLFASILSILMISVALGALVILGLRLYQEFDQTDAEVFEELWKSDLANLRAKGFLPAGLAEISEIHPVISGDFSQHLMDNIQIPLSTKPDGAFTLELLVTDWTEGQVTGVLVQYDLVDRKTKNLVWELARTFIIRGSKAELEKHLAAQPTDPIVKAASEYSRQNSGGTSIPPQPSKEAPKSGSNK